MYPFPKINTLLRYLQLKMLMHYVLKHEARFLSCVGTFVIVNFSLAFSLDMSVIIVVSISLVVSMHLPSTNGYYLMSLEFVT